MGGPQFREGQQIELASLAAQVRRLRIWVAVIAVFAAFASFAGGIANVKACESRHAIVDAGQHVIPSERELRAMLLAHKITRAEYEHGLANRRVWQSADCHWKHVIAP